MRVRRKSKKPVIIAAAISALIVAGIAWYYIASRPAAPVNQEGSVSEKNQTSAIETNNTRSDSDRSDVNTDNNSGQSVEHEKEKELPQLYEGDNASNSNTLTGVVTTKSVVGSYLVIRNTINQLVGGGSCILTLTSGGKTITRSADIVQNPSSSTCAGFDIPVSDIGQGRWNIQIDITSGDKRATIKDTVSI